MSNQGQIDYWNGDVGATWVREADIFDLMFADLGKEMLARAALVPNERVLDIGCGSGATAFAAQDRVGAEGQVIGLDVSLPLVMLARQRAEELGSPVRFMDVDAASWSNASLFDVVTSRCGIMFFENPEEAFANLLSLTKPGGRLSFSCWRRANESEFVTLSMRVAAPLLAEPMATPDPLLPGPHAFGDKNRIQAVLSAAGWRDIVIEAWDGVIQVPGHTALESAAFLAGLGGLARLVREKKINEGQFVDALTDALEERMENGKISLKSPAWLVTARH